MATTLPMPRIETGSFAGSVPGDFLSNFTALSLLLFWRKFMYRFVQSLVLLLLLVSSTRGDFIVTVGNFVSTNRAQPVTVDAGGTVQLGIYLHSDLTVNPLTFTSLGMAFDISKPGAGFYDGNTQEFKTLLTDFTLTWAPTQSGSLDISGPTTVDSSIITDRGYDVLMDITPSVAISLPINGTQNTALHIANVSFKVGASAQGGSYGFKFNPFAAFDGADAGTANSSGPGGLTFGAGADGSSFNRFTVTAVPEPPTFILVGLASSSVAFAAWRKRRRKDISRI